MADPVCSPRTAELMREAAMRLLDQRAAGLAVVHAATLAGAPAPLASDPALVASMTATTRGNLLHWLSQVVLDPTADVPPAVSREGLSLARDLVRRGLDAGALNTYRAGQNAAWQLWMDTCFTLTDDPDELRDLLRCSARSIFGYVDATMQGITSLVEAERDSLAQSTHAQRWEAVNLVLEGAPISLDTASRRLGHDLRRPQTAAVLWREPAAPNDGDLERAADALALRLGAPRPLTVVATATSLWAWYATAGDPDLADVAAATRPFPGLRVALGAPAAGLAGFRTSHLDALATQRLMLRAPAPLPFATFDEVSVVSLLTADGERAREFVARTLGALATAEPVLRETLRTYLREDSSATRTARELFTHRNTVLNRLARARALLPGPLEGRTLPIGLALEVVHWLGTG